LAQALFQAVSAPNNPLPTSVFEPSSPSAVYVTVDAKQIIAHIRDPDLFTSVWAAESEARIGSDRVQSGVSGSEGWKGSPSIPQTTSAP